jgi:hypothetical protein
MKFEKKNRKKNKVYLPAPVCAREISFKFGDMAIVPVFKGPGQNGGTYCPELLVPKAKPGQKAVTDRDNRSSAY